MTALRSWVRSLLFLGAAALLAAHAPAQTGAFPVRPLKLVVPFPAGGSSDILGRVFADRVGTELGQSVIVDNRTGGNTVVGTQAVASAKPDGYSILQVTPNAVIVASLQANLPYDVEKDFAPVIGVGAVPLLLVVPANSDIRSIADLVKASKITPGGISYASGGIGSLGHLVPARFAHELKMSATHVPYRGVAPALQDVVGGRVQFMFVSSIEGMQMVGPKGVRVLGITAEQRHPTLPDVPTMTELGFADFVPAVWYGFVVPDKTPKEAVDRLYQAFAKAANDPGVREKLGRLGLTVQVRSAADFGRLMREEAKRWGQVVKENNIKME